MRGTNAMPVARQDALKHRRSSSLPFRYKWINSCVSIQLIRLLHRFVPFYSIELLVTMAMAVQSVQDVPQPKLDTYTQVAESKHERELTRQH